MSTKTDAMSLELLKRNFRLDEGTKTFTMVLRYDSAEELVDGRMSTPENVILNGEIGGDIMNCLQDIPRGYRGSVELRVADFGDYRPESLMEAARLRIAMSQVRCVREEVKNSRLFWTLVGAGVLFLAFMAYAESRNMFNDLIMEILDIGGWVFIWEGFTVRFLTPSEILHEGRVFRKKLRTLSLTDEKDRVLQSMDWKGFARFALEYNNSRKTKKD